MGTLKNGSTPKSTHFNAGRTRTRPCVYCGAFFFDIDKLKRHEEIEGEKFREEREKIQREKPGLAVAESQAAVQRERVPPPPSHHGYYHHPPPVNVVFYRIDRTVEEFGEDWEEDQIYPPFVHQAKALKRFRHISTPTHANNNNNYQKQAAFASLNTVRPKFIPPTPEQDYCKLEENSWITIEPTRLPRMPEARIVVQSQLDEYLTKLNEEEWTSYIKEQIDPSPPVKGEDPNRMDCKHCGLIFNDIHVRKFHEEGHSQPQPQPIETERLSCSYCGKHFPNVQHRKLHEKAHMSLQEPQDSLPQYPEQPQPPIGQFNGSPAPIGQFNGSPAPAIGGQFICDTCGRDFVHQSEMLAHKNLFCRNQRPGKPMESHSRPAKYSSPSNQKPRLAEQEGWIEDHPTLPKGWKIRSRPRATQAGQLFFLFLSPDLKIFHSRKKVMEHMEKLGGYTQFDYDKVREGAKNPKRFNGDNKRKHEEFLDDEDSREATPVKRRKPEKKKGEDDWTPSAKNGKKQEDHEEEKTEKTEDGKSKRSRANLSFKDYF